MLGGHSGVKVLLNNLPKLKSLASDLIYHMILSTLIEYSFLYIDTERSWREYRGEGPG